MSQFVRYTVISTHSQIHIRNNTNGSFDFEYIYIYIYLIQMHPEDAQLDSDVCPFKKVDFIML